MIIFTLMICYIPQTNVKAERDFFEGIGEWPIKTTPYSYIEDKNKSNGYIEPSNNQFKSAAKKKYSSEWNIISADITAPYETHIYHFEAPKSGYYTALTQGNLDTVGAIYEHQNVLMFTKNYDKVAYDDDNTIHIGNRKNCSMTIKMDKGEDYYIVIRAWSGNTGNYKLIIGPNLDFNDNSDEGGVWSYIDHYNDPITDRRGIKYYLNQATFLTEELTLAEYLSLNNNFHVMVNGVNYNAKSLSNVSKNKGNDVAVSIAEIMISECISSLSASVAPGLLFAAASVLVDFVSNNSSVDMRDYIADLCGISGMANVVAGSAQVTLTCKYGLRIDHHYNKPGSSARGVFTTEYSAWDTDTYMTGEKRHYGKWNELE